MDIIRSLGVTTLVTLLSAHRSIKQPRKTLNRPPERRSATDTERQVPQRDEPGWTDATRPRPSCN
jgi:hypothetical protein